MVMKITLRVKEDISRKLNKLPKILEKENERTLKNWSEFTRNKARMYSQEITGRGSLGKVTGRLTSSIQASRTGKRQRSVFIAPKGVTKGKYNYAELQERGYGPITGFHPAFTSSGWKMRKGGVFPRVQGKRFMQRAAVDGERAAKVMFPKSVKTAIIKSGIKV